MYVYVPPLPPLSSIKVPHRSEATFILCTVRDKNSVCTSVAHATDTTYSPNVMTTWTSRSAVMAAEVLGKLHLTIAL